MAASGDTSDRLEIGRIDKVHGLRGEVVVGFVTNMIEERTTPGVVLWADDVPLEVLSARPHGKKWLINFVGVVGREAAEGLRGKTLTAPPLAAENEVFVHELIGRRLVDQHGTEHGTVVSVIDNPASDLLELEDGRLVPLSFYGRHDESFIHVDVPPGLLDEDFVSERTEDSD